LHTVSISVKQISKIHWTSQWHDERQTHLTGAPRDWAGFKRTVIVVSVSLRGESVSYSGMDGAADTELC